jgi:NADPH-dependent curcumin reductase CurA
MEEVSHERSVAMRSREVQLSRRPEGVPTADDFEIVETEVGEPGAGEVVVRNLYMSVDPYMRGRMRDRKSYAKPYGVNETMTGGAIGRVVASRDPDLEEGAYVLSNLGWREAFRASGDALSPLGELVAPPSAYLGVIGMPGMTAYVGLFQVADLKDGETVFVSGAAGAVGSVAGQIAKIRNCRVVGSAGSAEKVRWLTEELGFDHAFNYKEGNLRSHIRDGAPEGIDVYFDNVGGDQLETAISEMRLFGRIAMCGAISQYNATGPEPGPSNLSRFIGMGLTLRGFLVSHFPHVREQFLRDMGGWLASGRIEYRETVVDGIERAPEAFMGLFEGANIGKMVVRLDDGD